VRNDKGKEPAMFSEKRQLTKLGKQLLHTRKRAAYVSFRAKHSVEASYWSEGSRTLTYVMTMANGSVLVKDVNYGANPFTLSGDQPVVNLDDETIVFTGGTFCGKDATPFISAKDEETLAKFGLFK
jgi:hypothetical protein